MRNVIVRGFASVVRFKGRDSRAQFWPYAGATFALWFVMSSAVTTPIMDAIFAGPAEAARRGAVQFLTAMMGLIVVLVALLAAAVARRLHDTGRSALWGLLPLPFATYSGIMFFRVFEEFTTTETPDMALFLSVFLSNALYLGGLSVLIILLVLPGRTEPNRHGAPVES